MQQLLQDFAWLSSVRPWFIRNVRTQLCGRCASGMIPNMRLANALCALFCLAILP